MTLQETYKELNRLNLEPLTDREALKLNRIIYFDNLTESDIGEAFECLNDNIAAYFGSYGTPYLYAVTQSNETELEEATESTGGFICDKDEFLRLFQESGSSNPFLIELI